MFVRSSEVRIATAAALERFTDSSVAASVASPSTSGTFSERASAEVAVALGPLDHDHLLPLVEQSFEHLHADRAKAHDHDVSAHPRECARGPSDCCQPPADERVRQQREQGRDERRAGDDQQDAEGLDPGRLAREGEVAEADRRDRLDCEVDGVEQRQAGIARAGW